MSSRWTLLSTPSPWQPMGRLWRWHRLPSTPQSVHRHAMWTRNPPTSETLLTGETPYQLRSPWQKTAVSQPAGPAASLLGHFSCQRVIFCRSEPFVAVVAMVTMPLLSSRVCETETVPVGDIAGERLRLPWRPAVALASVECRRGEATWPQGVSNGVKGKPRLGSFGRTKKTQIVANKENNREPGQKLRQSRRHLVQRNHLERKCWPRLTLDFRLPFEKKSRFQRGKSHRHLTFHSASF